VLAGRGGKESGKPVISSFRREKFSNGPSILGKVSSILFLCERGAARGDGYRYKTEEKQSGWCLIRGIDSTIYPPRGKKTPGSGIKSKLGLWAEKGKRGNGDWPCVIRGKRTGHERKKKKKRNAFLFNLTEDGNPIGRRTVMSGTGDRN